MNAERRRQILKRLAEAKQGLDLEAVALRKAYPNGPHPPFYASASFLYEVIDVLSEIVSDHPGANPRCESRCPNVALDYDSQCVGNEGHRGAHVDPTGRKWL